MRLITIRMRIAGREVVFHRCARCEANSWQDDAGALTLGEVLDLARVASLSDCTAARTSR